MKRLAALAALSGLLTSCVTTGTVTLSSPDAPPLTFSTGKDVRSTAKSAALAAAAWYLQQLTQPHPTK
jgi:hypothetical protein